MRPLRVQGTDGVRGVVAQKSELKPVDAFIEQTVITPQFAAFYAAAYVEFLRTNDLLPDDADIVVGYDPRDPERKIIDAVMAGISSAGAKAVDVGILPTPALSLYMLESKAAGGVMITASHNPADQNGIKLFMPETALKLFPGEDMQVTELLYQIAEDGLDIEASATVCADQAEAAQRAFYQYMTEPFNSWIKKDKDLNNIMLVVDAANGALVPHLPEILDKFNFRAVEYVGADLDAEINDNCGAGLLEGQKIIKADFSSDTGADFRSMAMVQALFRHGKQSKEEMLSGNLRVCGAAFDGDADRCYMLEYDPYADRIIILGGDEVALLQAWFIRQNLGADYAGVATFAVTVESDIAVSLAAEELGFIPVATAVGDKWLLWEAHCGLLGSHWAVLETHSDDLEMLADLETVQEEFESWHEPKAIGMAQMQKAAAEAAKQDELELDNYLFSSEMLSFALGSEETGHMVTMGLLEFSNGDRQAVYMGNGLKSAINSLAATQAIMTEKSGPLFYAFLASPFEPGKKLTLPIYYTDKSRLALGSEIRETLEAELLAVASNSVGEKLTVEFRPRAEEPEMLYLAFLEKSDKGAHHEKLKAAIFVRNSGTESKSSVYLRAEQGLGEELTEVANKIAVRVSALMKDDANLYAKAERDILNHISSNGPSPFADIQHLATEVNQRRLMVEMSLKQNLISTFGDKLILTEHGEAVLAAGE
jgi:phosphoglucosamine mutase